MKIPKSEWGPGPWMSEPDVMEWRVGDVYCLIRRPLHHGALCGYVGVPSAHPWYDKSAETIMELTETSVSGVPRELTWASCRNFDSDDSRGTCFPSDCWIVGFGTDGINDIAPGREAIEKEYASEVHALTSQASGGAYPWPRYYRDLPTVRGWVLQLATLAGTSVVRVLSHDVGLNVTDGVVKWSDHPIPKMENVFDMVRGFISGRVEAWAVADYLQERYTELGLPEDIHTQVMATH